MPTFGIDPDEVHNHRPEPGELYNGWQQRPKKKKQGRSEHNELVWFFRNHRDQKMTHDFSPQQMQILQRTIKKMRGQGYTSEAVKDGIDRFYASGACERSKTPCQLFSSNSIQERIMRKDVALERVVPGTALPDVAKSILAWIDNSFQRTDSLPWPVGDDLPISVLLLSQDGTVALYTYPEVVAQLLADGGNFTEHLYDLVDAINWSHGDENVNAPDAEYLRGIIPALPEEILKVGGARPLASTLTEAIWRGTK